MVVAPRAVAGRTGDLLPAMLLRIALATLFLSDVIIGQLGHLRLQHHFQHVAKGPQAKQGDEGPANPPPIPESHAFLHEGPDYQDLLIRQAMIGRGNANSM